MNVAHSVVRGVENPLTTYLALDFQACKEFVEFARTHTIVLCNLSGGNSILAVENLVKVACALVQFGNSPVFFGNLLTLRQEKFLLFLDLLLLRGCKQKSLTERCRNLVLVGVCVSSSSQRSMILARRTTSYPLAKRKQAFLFRLYIALFSPFVSVYDVSVIMY